MKDKRAISPVVATVLLIVLVLILAAIIFLWARGFVGEQVEKFGEPVERACDKISYDFSLFGAGAGGERDVEAVNRGNVPIYNFQIKQIYSSGNSDMKDFYFVGVDQSSLGIGDAQKGVLSLDGAPDKIIIYPRILGSTGSGGGTPHTCLEKGITKQL